MTLDEQAHIAARLAVRDCLAEACDVPSKAELSLFGYDNILGRDHMVRLTLADFREVGEPARWVTAR